MNRLIGWWMITRLRIRYSRTAGSLLSTSLLWIGVILLPIDRIRAARFLMLSHRNAFDTARQIRRERLLVKHGLLAPRIIIPNVPPHENLPDDIYQRRIITLKESRQGEKGVILVKFLDTFSWMIRTLDMETLLTQYYVALEMSYFGVCRPEVLQYLQFAPTPIIVGGACPPERDFMTRVETNLVLSQYASSTWIDDRMFHPLTESKQYDCIMVQTWSPVKRHQLLFEALREINDPSYRALIAGGAYDGTRKEIELQIDYFGVTQNVEIREDVSHEELNVLYNRARVNLMLSLKEGGNKAIIEGMLANTPALIMADHVGLDHRWINEQTGKIATRHTLAATLLSFKTEKQAFSPRAWALENISAAASTRNLEQTVRDLARKANEPFTVGLVPKYNQGWMPKYYDPARTLAPIDFSKYRRSTALQET